MLSIASPALSTPPVTSASNIFVLAVCISTVSTAPETSMLASLFTDKQLENVSPSWMAPNEDGKVSSSDAFDKSLRVLGWPGRGSLPCKDTIEDVERAENEGELE